MAGLDRKPSIGIITINGYQHDLLVPSYDAFGQPALGIRPSGSETPNARLYVATFLPEQVGKHHRLPVNHRAETRGISSIATQTVLRGDEELHTLRTTVAKKEGLPLRSESLTGWALVVDHRISGEDLSNLGIQPPEKIGTKWEEFNKWVRRESRVTRFEVTIAKQWFFDRLVSHATPVGFVS